MSVPFSNTHLRIPRGFGTLLEGLTREVLRDQPEDIPAFAANYFKALLRTREDKGIDPVEWSTKLEERFYNNNAFQEFTPKNKASESGPVSKEIPQTQSEDESSRSEEDTDRSSTQLITSGEVGSTKGREEKIISEEKGFSLEESITNRPGSYELFTEPSETDKDPTSVFNQVDRAVNEKDNSSSPVHDLQSELKKMAELSADDCTREQQSSDFEVETNQTEETIDSTEPVGEKSTEESMIPDFVDVNVCASELGITQGEETEQRDNSFMEEEAFEERILKSPLSHPDISAAQLQAHIEAEKNEAEERAETRASSQKTDIFAHVEGEMDGNNVREEEEGLVETGFDDLPKARQSAGYEPSEMEASEILLSVRSPTQKQADSNDDNEVMNSDQDPDEIDMDMEAEDVSAHGGSDDEEEASDRLREILMAQDFDVNDDESGDEGSERGSEGHTPEVTDKPEVTVESYEEECNRPQEEEDIMDIPLDDPEANRAAAKIQAGFRGHMTRKKMKPEDKAEAEERQEDRGQ